MKNKARRGRTDLTLKHLCVCLAATATMTSNMEQALAESGCEQVRELYDEAVAQAQTLAAQGKALSAQGTDGRDKAKRAYLGAAQSYLKAYSLCDRLGSLRYGVALMYEKAGECERAQEYYRALLQDAKNPKAMAADPQMASVVKRAQGRLPAVEQTCSMARLEIRCAQANVYIQVDDGKESACPVQRDIKPGPHTVRARLEGHSGMKQTVHVAPSGVATLTISELSPISGTVKDPKVPQRAPAEPLGEPEAPGTIPVVAGVGGVVVGAGLLLAGGLLGQSTQDQIEEKSITPVDAQAQLEGSNQLLLAGAVVASLGAASTLVGLVLNGQADKAFQDKQNKKKIDAMGASLQAVELSLTPTGGTFGVRWRF